VADKSILSGERVVRPDKMHNEDSVGSQGLLEESEKKVLLRNPERDDFLKILLYLYPDGIKTSDYYEHRGTYS